MRKSSEIRGRLARWTAAVKEPRVAMRILIGTLLAANLVAAIFAFKPFGGSAADLVRQEDALQSQLQQLQAHNTRAKALVEKVEHARTDGDQFLETYVNDRRTTMSAIEAELNRMAAEAGIKRREAAQVLDPIEGSDTLGMMTITAGFEGNYASLTKFVNLIDKSPRFLIIENMVTAPQQGGQNLNVSLKLDAFIKEEPGSPS
jgi:type IV pilus assembly protein PilO